LFPFDESAFGLPYGIQPSSGSFEGVDLHQYTR